LRFASPGKGDDRMAAASTREASSVPERPRARRRIRFPKDPGATPAGSATEELGRSRVTSVPAALSHVFTVSRTGITGPPLRAGGPAPRTGRRGRESRRADRVVARDDRGFRGDGGEGVRTESYRLRPPLDYSDYLRNPRYASPASGAASGGEGEDDRVDPGGAETEESVRSRRDGPPTERNCFGTERPSGRPVPPATTMATVPTDTPRRRPLPLQFREPAKAASTTASVRISRWRSPSRAGNAPSRASSVRRRRGPSRSQEQEVPQHLGDVEGRADLSFSMYIRVPPVPTLRLELHLAFPQDLVDERTAEASMIARSADCSAFPIGIMIVIPVSDPQDVERLLLAS